jgi:hypothetical protein
MVGLSIFTCAGFTSSIISGVGEMLSPESAIDEELAIARDSSLRALASIDAATESAEL